MGIGKKLVVGIVVSCSFWVGITYPAEATWSVVAVDPQQRQVGVAFASCVSAEVLGEPDGPLVPLVVDPGRGAGIYTEVFDTNVESEMLALLAAGVRPDEIVNALVTGGDEKSDQGDSSNPRLLGQYGVVAIDGASASLSGEKVTGGSSRRGSSYAVQSNLDDSGDVTTQAALAVETSQAEGDPLPELLVEALAAGSEAGGDRRCGTQTALFAQVVVAEQDDDSTTPSTVLTVVVDEGDGQNPAQILVTEYKQGSQGLVDVGQGSGRGVWIYGLAFVAVIIMGAGGAMVFRHGFGSRAARR